MRPRQMRRGLLVALAAGLIAVPVTLPAVAQAGKSDSKGGKSKKVSKPKGRFLYATDNKGQLITFREKGSERIVGNRKIVGLPTGVVLVGIDFRPKTGELFGIGSDSVAYRLVLYSGRKARALNVGAGFGGAGNANGTAFLNGTAFGVDFNPVPDAIRVVSEANQNLRLSPTTGGQGMGSPDMALNPGDPTVVAAAYTNSQFSFGQPLATTLYTIDAASNTLNIQNPPNNGTQTLPMPLGIDVSNVVGFDIVGAGTPAYLTNAGPKRSTLYSVNLTTGQAKKLGDIATLGRKKQRVKTITGLAAVQD